MTVCGLNFWRPLALGLAVAFVSATASPAQAPSLAERIEACGACHGDDGNSRMEKIPSIAGQPAFFILNQLVLMREGVRPIEAMVPFVKDLTDEDINALAEHFAKLEPKPSDEKIDPELVRRGAALSEDRKCVSCHLDGFEGTQQIPRLARQRVDYLIQALKEFRDGRRPGSDTIMSQPVSGLSDDDLVALAHYAASR